MRGVMVRAAEGLIFILDPFTVDRRNLGLRLRVGKGQPQKLPRMVFFTGHIVHRHMLADAVPAEIPHGPVTRGGLPGLEILKLLRYLHPVSKTDFHQPADRQACSTAGNSGKLSNKHIGRQTHAGGIAPTDCNHIAPVPEGIVERPHNVAVRSGIFQVQQCVIAIVQPRNGAIRGPVAEHNQVFRNWHGPGR